MNSAASYEGGRRTVIAKAYEGNINNIRVVKKENNLSLRPFTT